ncbi:MAG: DinB family protein [Bacteroidota bacterium]
MSIHSELLHRSAHHCRWNMDRIEGCLAKIEAEEVWLRPNGNSLSIGNQLLHLSGNLRQWIIHSLGGAMDNRQRSDEFSTTAGQDKAQLLALLQATVAEAILTIQNLTEEELLRERTVQVYHLSGAAALIHAVEHFSYHTGQIIFWTKQLRDQQMDFYGGQALDTTN